MDYYVVGKDGSKFGPANLGALNGWAAQGRILADTILERVSDGVRGPAALLPGLNLPTEAISAKAEAGAPPVVGETAPARPPADGPMHSPASPTHGETQPAGPYPGYPRQPVYNYREVPHELRGRFNWGAFLLTWIWGLNHKAYVTLISLGIGIVAFIFNAIALSVIMSASNASVSRAPESPPFMQDPESPFSEEPGTPWVPPTTLPGPARQKKLPTSNPVLSLLGMADLALMIWYGAKGTEWAWSSGRFRTPEDCRRCQVTWGWWGLGVKAFTCIAVLGVMFTIVLAAGNQGGFR